MKHITVQHINSGYAKDPDSLSPWHRVCALGHSKQWEMGYGFKALKNVIHLNVHVSPGGVNSTTRKTKTLNGPRELQFEHIRDISKHTGVHEDWAKSHK